MSDPREGLEADLAELADLTELANRGLHELPSPRARLASRSTAPPVEAAVAESAPPNVSSRGKKKRPGKSAGRKREITLYLTRELRDRLDQHARTNSTSRGDVLMAAARAGYQAAADAYREKPVADANSPFPPPRRARRRLHVPDRTQVSALVWPDEAEALAKVADELELSMSAFASDMLTQYLP